MRLLNPTLFKPGNVLVIGLIAVVTHLALSPVYKMIDNKTTPTTGQAGS